jgi:hypothetical protein
VPRFLLCKEVEELFTGLVAASYTARVESTTVRYRADVTYEGWPAVAFTLGLSLVVHPAKRLPFRVAAR